MIRLYAIPWSTNVERVALALAHKGLQAEAVILDAGDRSPVHELSGQDLVPVIDDAGRVVADSTAILEYLEERYPNPPLYPADRTRRTEMRVFIDWFNRVWKVAPNAIADARPSGDRAERARIDELSREMAASLDWFAALLDGRDYLFGDEPSAVDFATFPFLKYAAIPPDPADDEVFHHVLTEHQRLADEHSGVRGWIERIDALPRSPSTHPRRP